MTFCLSQIWSPVAKRQPRRTAARMKMIYALLATVLVGGVHCTGPLPEYMMGNFVLETSEGFNDYMYEIGVDWFTRKVVLDKVSICLEIFVILRLPVVCGPPHTMNSLVVEVVRSLSTQPPHSSLHLFHSN